MNMPHYKINFIIKAGYLMQFFLFSPINQLIIFILYFHKHKYQDKSVLIVFSINNSNAERCRRTAGIKPSARIKGNEVHKILLKNF